MRLHGKTALVTGAGSGFGRAIAALFLREGADVVMADIDGETLACSVQALQGEAAGRAHAVTGDVAAMADAARMVAAAEAAFGGLDIVVNNAGILNHKTPLEEVAEATFDRLMAVNVKSLFCMSAAAVPLLRRQGRGGSIVNIGSTGGLRPRPGLVWYNGTKGAVHAISKSMAAELAPDRIRVNCVAPVMAPTGMLEAALGGDSPAARARVIETIPLGRFCAPEDIANACLWLAEDTAAFVTGVVLPVDGGRTI